MLLSFMQFQLAEVMLSSKEKKKKKGVTDVEREEGGKKGIQKSEEVELTKK